MVTTQLRLTNMGSWAVCPPQLRHTNMDNWGCMPVSAHLHGGPAIPAVKSLTSLSYRASWPGMKPSQCLFFLRGSSFESCNSSCSLCKCLYSYILLPTPCPLKSLKETQMASLGPFINISDMLTQFTVATQVQIILENGEGMQGENPLNWGLNLGLSP